LAFYDCAMSLMRVSYEYLSLVRYFSQLAILNNSIVNCILISIVIGSIDLN